MTALSRHQLEILSEFAAGKGCSDIAHARGVSRKTVWTQKQRMMRKLEIETPEAWRKFVFDWSHGCAVVWVQDAVKMYARIGP